MYPSRGSPKIDYWSTLNAAQRFQVALAVARRRGRAFRKAIDNVVSVGAGFRLRGPENALVEEVCLCFMVRHKWADRRTRVQKIPGYVTAYALVQGRRVRVRIPTDVSEFKGGDPHAVLNLTDGILSRVHGDVKEFGAGCCLVRNAAIPNERYLLSCYHVFSKTLARPPETGIDCIANDVVIGPISAAARADGPAALDAALILVDDETIQDVSVWGQMPRSRATDFDIESLPMRGQLFILGRRVAPAVGNISEEIRGRPIPAAFRAVLPNSTDYDYRATAGRFFTFADTIEYVANVRPGDSGAALVDSAGMLYGMHFFGRGQFGYALAAPRLFDPEIFPFDIIL